MDNYIVSARKYRPITFDSVVGQQSLTNTLKNAIRTNHLAHAYLFCGPRGVGKTTCARIFAKTINCLTPTESHDACNECESCRAFNEQRSFNIHELDAASNNSVENIRDIIKEVMIPPQIGKYSVYIIDEVHMLSTGAFNALLKTLEEPPSYAIFILATTEKHKVPPTILSRCQVYDFQRITISDIISHLQFVAKSEGLTADEQALAVVAKYADGGMRDALSIFDQLVAYSGKEVTYQKTIEVLNILDSDYYFRITDAAFNAQYTEVLTLFDAVLQKGFEAGTFVNGLESHLRDVLVAKDKQTLPLLDTAESVKEQYIKQAQTIDAVWLFNALDLLNQCLQQYRSNTNKRLTVEINLLKLCRLNEPKTEYTLPKVGNQPAGTAQPVRPTTPVTPKQPTKTVNNTIPQVIPSINRVQPVATTPTASTAVPATPQSSPFTADQFNDAWIGLKRLFPREERLISILNNAHPTLLSETEVSITVNNPWQKEEYERFSNKITESLRQTLDNNRISISVIIDDSQKSQTAYTSDEKIKRMTEQYTQLQTFKDTLGLIVE